MLNAQEIVERAKSLNKGELSSQSKAVTEALVEALNEQLKRLNEYYLNQQAQLLQRQVDAVKKTPTGRMKKPTTQEALAQGKIIQLPEGECCKFFDYYEANGWRVGRNPMKLWTAAMANWKRNWQGRTFERNENKPKQASVNF